MGMLGFPISTAPRDRVIDVHSIDEDIWLRVKWDDGADWFELIGEDVWVLPIELDGWRDVAGASS